MPMSPSPSDDGPNVPYFFRVRAFNDAGTSFLHSNVAGVNFPRTRSALRRQKESAQTTENRQPTTALFFAGISTPIRFKGLRPFPACLNRSVLCDVFK